MPDKSLSLIDHVCLWGQFRAYYPELLAALHALLVSDRSTVADLESLQTRKLLKLLGEALRHSAFHAQRVSVALDDLAHQDLNQILRRLPVLKKEDIRSNAHQIRTALDSRTFSSRTGGTTGIPLDVIKCRQAAAWGNAAFLRGQMYAGVRPGSRGALIKGFNKISLRGRLKMRLLRKHLMQAYSEESGASSPEHLLSLIDSGRIDFIEGFVSNIYALAERIRPRNSVKALFLTGEAAQPHQLEKIQEAFHSPVHCYYGSNEIWGIAFQCEKHEYHVAQEHVVVEVVDSNGRPVMDAPGDILVTDLDNRAMPFIRYQIGDRGILHTEPCTCGRSHQRLSLLGREQEYLVNAAGFKLPAVFFRSRFRDFKDIGRLQMVQKDAQTVLIRFDGDTELARQEASQLKDIIEQKMGSQMEVELCQTAAMKVAGYGKVPLIVREF